MIHDKNVPLTVEVIRCDFRGAVILYTLRLADGNQVRALVPSHCSHERGEKIGIVADVRHVIVFPEDSH